MSAFHHIYFIYDINIHKLNMWTKFLLCNYWGLFFSSKQMDNDDGTDNSIIDCHVEKYLKQSISYVNKDPQSEWGVYIMFLHCYEVK